MRILFVDDEPHLLAGLRRLTRASRSWTTSFAAGAAEALEILQDTPVDVVVTDMRMPGMDGLDLMESLIEHHPALGRVVLTGHVEDSRIEQAMSLAHVWLNKPCTLDALSTGITEAHQAASLRPTGRRSPN